MSRWQPNARDRLERAAVELFIGKRQGSERKRAVAHARPPCGLADGAYAACGTTHTSPHRSWNRQR